MKIVPHYGIHRDDEDIAYLMQGRSGSNAVGLKAMPPFQVRLANGKRHCNHQIPLANPVPNDLHWEKFLELLDDPLVRAMMPLPKQAGGAFYLKDDEEKTTRYLYMLSRMSSPINHSVVPFWMTNLQSIIEELQNTNVQPFVVTTFVATNSSDLAKIGQAAVYNPRVFIGQGASDVSVPHNIKKIETELPTGKYGEFNDLQILPWESLGATVLRKWMRGEAIMKGAPARGIRKSDRPDEDQHDQNPNA